jgi:hypothetical protein
MHASLFLPIISKVYRRQRRAFLSQIKSSQTGNAAAGFAFARMPIGKSRPPISVISHCPASLFQKLISEKVDLS